MKDLNNDIDRFFTDGIEPSGMRPSEKVWEGIDKNLDKKLFKQFQGKISTLQKAVAGLSAALLLMAGFEITYFLKDNKQLPGTKQIQSERFPVPAASSSAIIPHDEVAAVLRQKDNAALTEKTVTANSQKHKVFILNKPARLVFSGNQISDQEKTFESLKNGASTDQSSVSSQSEQNEMIVKIDQVVEEREALPIESLVSALKTNAPAESPAPVNNIPSVNTETASRIYIEGFFSPDFSKKVVKDDNTYDEYELDDLLDQEEDLFSYSAGAKVGYDIKKWSVQSGFFYSKHSFSISPQTIYSVSSKGNPQYMLVTSNGTVEIPSETSQPADSIEISSNSYQTLGFVGIPAQVKYHFSGEKFSFYSVAGISANFLIKQETYLSLTDGINDDESDKSISGIEGVRKINCSYMLGAGARYRLRKGIYLAVEPALRGTIIPINENTPVKTSPYFLGLGLGIGYHF